MDPHAEREQRHVATPGPDRPASQSDRARQQLLDEECARWERHVATLGPVRPALQSEAAYAALRGQLADIGNAQRDTDAEGRMWARVRAQQARDPADAAWKAKLAALRQLLAERDA